jgi:hypothetical protein
MLFPKIHLSKRLPLPHREDVWIDVFLETSIQTSSPTPPGQVREVSLNDEISREDEMIPQLNQIPVWITNRCEQSYTSGTNFRSAPNIASHSRANAQNLISVSLEKSVTNSNNMQIVTKCFVGKRKISS